MKEDAKIAEYKSVNLQIKLMHENVREFLALQEDILNNASGSDTHLMKDQIYVDYLLNIAENLNLKMRCMVLQSTQDQCHDFPGCFQLYVFREIRCDVLRQIRSALQKDVDDISGKGGYHMLGMEFQQIAKDFIRVSEDIVQAEADLQRLKQTEVSSHGQNIEK